MSRKKIILGALFQFFTLILHGQDVYTFENRWKYAQYLAKSNRYDAACKELYAIIQDSTLKSPVLSKSYYTYALLSGHSHFDANVTSYDDTTAYLQWLFRLRKYTIKDTHAKAFVKRDTLFKSQILLDKLEMEIKKQHQKSAKVTIASILLPGLGKACQKQYWEGLSTFGVIAILSGYSAGAFYFQGQESFLGWGFAICASIGYIAQIHGSIFTLKRLSKQRQKDIIEAAIEDAIHY